jgi:hypothetical protein
MTVNMADMQGVGTDKVHAASCSLAGSRTC